MRTYTMDEIVDMLDECYDEAFKEAVKLDNPFGFQVVFNDHLDSNVDLIINFLKHSLRMRAFTEFKDLREEKEEE